MESEKQFSLFLSIMQSKNWIRKNNYMHTEVLPPKGKKYSRGPSTSDTKSVTPSQRVRQYTSENLSVSNKKLLCLACREELSVKSSVINYHIKSTKHISGKKRLETQRKSEIEIL